MTINNQVNRTGRNAEIITANIENVNIRTPDNSTFVHLNKMVEYNDDGNKTNNIEITPDSTRPTYLTLSNEEGDFLEMDVENVESQEAAKTIHLDVGENDEYKTDLREVEDEEVRADNKYIINGPAIL